MEMVPSEVVLGFENNSKDMMEPWEGRVENCEPEGPVERLESTKKEIMGSNEPKKRVSLSATPSDWMTLLNCWMTADASVWPAMEGMLPKALGELISNSCWDA